MELAFKFSKVENVVLILGSRTIQAPHKDPADRTFSIFVTSLFSLVVQSHFLFLQTHRQSAL